MLKRFEVKNYRGFSENLIFDLSAKNYNFNQQLTHNSIVNKAIIYGKNGIGKSDLGFAIFDLSSHLTDNMTQHKDNYHNLDHISEPITFKYIFKFGNDEIVYQYDKMDLNYLIREKLSYNGDVIINYDYFNITEECRFIHPTLKGNLNINLVDNKLSVLKYIYRNTPINPSSPLTKLMKFCEGMLWYRCLWNGNSYMGYTTGVSDLCDIIYENRKLNEFEAFLKENGLEYNLQFELINGKPELYAYYNNGQNKAPFVSLASTGTQALLLFFSWNILAFESLSFLFIDEFDAFFHYGSAECIINLLNQNSKFQSIVTTHNTYLMQNKLTRPDCCFLMTKNKIANLYDSTDREIREAHNLEKMYINGAFTN